MTLRDRSVEYFLNQFKGCDYYEWLVTPGDLCTGLTHSQINSIPQAIVPKTLYGYITERTTNVYFQQKKHHWFDRKFSTTVFTKRQIMHGTFIRVLKCIIVQECYLAAKRVIFWEYVTHVATVLLGPIQRSCLSLYKM